MPKFRQHKARIGILGGTFDPIHQGHLQLAQYCLDKLKLNVVYFTPCQQPTHKYAAQALPWQRAAMIALSIVNHPHFFLDVRELTRATPSYAVLTAADFAASFPQAELYWLMGEDAFAGFTRWYCWQDLARYCHLGVVNRHSNTNTSSAAETQAIVQHFTCAKKKIEFVTMPVHCAASTKIRLHAEALMAFTPHLVREYILENKLYGF